MNIDDSTPTFALLVAVVLYTFVVYTIARVFL